MLVFPDVKTVSLNSSLEMSWSIILFIYGAQ